MSLLDTFTTSLANKIGLNTNRLPNASEGFNVSKFRSQVLGNAGFLRKNLFLVRIYFPDAFSTRIERSFGIRTRELMMYTENFTAPGIALATSDDIHRYGTGPTAKYAYGAVFTDISASFLADGRGEILKLFQTWMKYIVNYDSSKNSPNGLNGAEPYEVGYKDDYACRIEVIVYNEAAEKIITYTINEAFPVFLGDISLSWADNDSIMRIPVSFSYRDWQTDTMSAASITGSASQNLTLLQKIIKVGTIAQTIGTLKKPQNIGDAINLVNNANIISGGLSGII